MDLEAAKTQVDRAEAELGDRAFVTASSFVRDGRRLDVAITDRLRKVCRKGRVWKSKAFLTAYKNAEYGFDEARARSAGGADGIFLLTRDYRPRNTMMKKIFDQFLDKAGSGIAEIARELGVAVDGLFAVRLVSHHMRLLGLLHRGAERDVLVLVDYDDTK